MAVPPPTPPGPGTTGNTSYGNSFAGFRLVDPRSLYKACLDRHVDPSPWWGKANTYRHVVGEEPGRGFLLLTYADMAAIDWTKDHNLVAQDEAKKLTFKRLTIVGATCVLSSALAVDERVYLVEVADRRVHLARVPWSRGYNLRHSQNGAYVQFSTLDSNGTTPWTWTQVVSDLWTAHTSLASGNLGAYPGLPFTPDGLPDGLAYFDSWAWHALNDVLARIACAMDYDPLTDTFSIVRVGTGSSSESPALVRLGNEVKTWEGDPFDSWRANRPYAVRVLFRLTPKNTLIATAGPSFYQIDVTLPAKPGVIQGTYVKLYDDLFAYGRDPFSGNPTNLTALQTRAQERADDWVRKSENRDRRILQEFRDLTGDPAVVVGGLATGATWGDRAEGWRSELESGPDGGLERWKQPQDAGEIEVYVQQNWGLLPYLPPGYVPPGYDTTASQAFAAFDFGTIDKMGLYLFEVRGAVTIYPAKGFSLATFANRHRLWTLYGQLSFPFGAPYETGVRGANDDNPSNSILWPIVSWNTIEIPIPALNVPIDPTSIILGGYWYREGASAQYTQRWIMKKATDQFPTTLQWSFVAGGIGDAPDSPATVPIALYGPKPSWTMTRLDQTWFRDRFNQSGQWVRQW